MGVRFTLDGDPFELTPELVRARLQGYQPENIRDYWVEIDGTHWPVKQVISVATGVRDRQRFQSQSSRRWLGNLGFSLGRVQHVIPRTGPPALPSPGPAKPKSGAELPQRDLVLVGCVKTKRDVGALAKDLYTSDYFVKMRTYAEATGLPWFILSAEHGLISPDEWLEPYERYLPETSRDYRRAWGQKVAAQLEHAVGSLDGLFVDVHAGAAYIDSVEDALQQRGAQVIDQLKGLSLGGGCRGTSSTRGLVEQKVPGWSRNFATGCRQWRSATSLKPAALACGCQVCTAGGSTRRARSTSAPGWGIVSSRVCSTRGSLGRLAAAVRPPRTRCGGESPLCTSGKGTSSPRCGAASGRSLQVPTISQPSTRCS